MTDIMDRHAALSALSGSEELLGELARIFCEDAPRTLHEVGNLLTTGDVAQSLRAVHKLKGQASAFFSSRTTSLILKLEDRLSNEPEHAELNELFHDVSRQVTELCRHLRSAEFHSK